MRRFCLLFTLMGCALSVNSENTTQQKYLSGTGLGDTKNWAFFCTGGSNSNKWDSIAVPSQWELEGYGDYTYGRWYTISKETQPSMEEGFYKTSFTIPTSWKDKKIEIIFDGSMTDTEVKINGKLAGDIHQGAFYQFSYDITDKLDFEKDNILEVKVAKHSSDKNVNAAERKADWWIFGGIYRPVYLEAKPQINIDRIAIDPKADGTLNMQLFTTDIPKGYSADLQLSTLEGEVVANKQVSLNKGTRNDITVKFDDVKAWDVENPNLYILTVNLKDKNNQLIHKHNERIGFRTVDFRKQDGLYVNGTKVILKGINRHSFHPDGGRTTNKDISIEDILLMKEMNMNAVRFHYAPDKHFLEACDSMGMFVMNELCGWQNGYGENLAPKLVTEFINRDVNHPSILLWSNGNEGGWSTSVDTMFHLLDPQKRHVLHPWADYNDLDAHHYPAFQTGIARFHNGYRVFMPTEFMHGMYDQGHGAGLEDFWNNYTSHPLFAGGFMWDFSDNAVKRTDLNGILDSDGSNGTDGILGPYREKEASYYVVRDIWAPIQFNLLYITPSFNGEFMITNDYLYTNLDKCRMDYKVSILPSPLLKGQAPNIISQGEITLPALEPGTRGKLKMNMPENFFEGDVLEITAYHPDGKEMCSWTWPVNYAKGYMEKQYSKIAGNNSLNNNKTKKQKKEKASYSVVGENLTLSANGVNVIFNINDGIIQSVKNNDNQISFINGPIPVGMKTKFKESYYKQSGDDAIFVAKYHGGIDSIEWKMQKDGLLRMNAIMLNRDGGGSGFDDAFFEQNITNLGLTFSYPEEKVEGARWYGKGPYRVWKNRQRGMNYDIHEKEYNNTITGESFENLIYPEFKGYHANMYWLTLQNAEQPFTVYSESDGVFIRLFTPEEPKNNKTRGRAFPRFPEGDISFLYEIPGIHCFKPIAHHGPKSQPGMIRIKKGDEGIKMNLVFDFR